MSVYPITLLIIGNFKGKLTCDTKCKQQLQGHLLYLLRNLSTTTISFFSSNLHPYKLFPPLSYALSCYLTLSCSVFPKFGFQREEFETNLILHIMQGTRLYFHQVHATPSQTSQIWVPSLSGLSLTIKIKQHLWIILNKM